MRSLFVLTIFLLGMPLLVFAQTDDATPQAPTSLEPGREEEQRSSSSPRIKRSRSERGSVVETEKEYVARMKRTVKEIRKKEKEMKKPQYANPLYFGHKRPPKKNKAGHLKVCKECGIRH
jgi:hypothetical protein